MRVILFLCFAVLQATAFRDIDTIDKTDNFKIGDHDVIIAINDEFTTGDGLGSDIMGAVNAYKGVDPDAGSKVQLIPFLSNPCGKLIVAPTGLLNDDTADSRRIYNTASAAIRIALEQKLRKIVLVVGNFTSAKPKVGAPVHYHNWAKDIYPQLLAMMGTLHELYTPLQVREMRPDLYPKYDSLKLYNPTTPIYTADLITLIKAMETGRYVTRDLCASDQERMTPPKVGDYVKQQFTPVTRSPNSYGFEVTVAEIDKAKYPTMASVDRVYQGSASYPPYQGRTVHLTYTPQGPVSDALYFVGKGVTYDAGGTDLKTNGYMRWMKKDKCGASAIAGFMKVVEMLKPSNIRVHALLGFVRNMIGAEAFAPNEIITSKSGKTSIIGSTDAEGRNVMVDLLFEAKNKAIKDLKLNPKVAPHLFTIATLTGHVGSSFGHNTAIIDNGPARNKNFAIQLSQAGDTIAEIGELSSLRLEDYEICYPVTQYEDFQQRNTHPNTKIYRGHQYPMAWMSLASDLVENGLQGTVQIPYTHLDVSASVGVKHVKATGIPTNMLTVAYIFPNLPKPASTA